MLHQLLYTNVFYKCTSNSYSLRNRRLFSCWQGIFILKKLFSLFQKNNQKLSWERYINIDEIKYNTNNEIKNWMLLKNNNNKIFPRLGLFIKFQKVSDSPGYVIPHFSDAWRLAFALISFLLNQSFITIHFFIYFLSSLTSLQLNNQMKP